MSMSAGRRPESAAPRRTIATYTTYADAERAVDWLSDQGFPVGRVAIVGTGLRSVEQVRGRLPTGRAALTGAGQGALIGLLFALLFGLFFTGPAFLGLLLYAVVLGALLGALFGALGHVATGGRRDFSSVAGMQAEAYEVQVDDEVAAEAQRILETLPSAPARGLRGDRRLPVCACHAWLGSPRAASTRTRQEIARSRSSHATGSGGTPRRTPDSAPWRRGARTRRRSSGTRPRTPGAPHGALGARRLRLAADDAARRRVSRSRAGTGVIARGKGRARRQRSPRKLPAKSRRR